MKPSERIAELHGGRATPPSLRDTTDAIIAYLDETFGDGVPDVKYDAVCSEAVLRKHRMQRSAQRISTVLATLEMKTHVDADEMPALLAALRDARRELL